LVVNMGINRHSESMKEIIRSSTKKSAGNYVLKQHKL
jgi:hypothetical protein